MADLKSVVLYLARHYPFSTELSKARLTKMVYLADWRSAISRHKQLTDIEWEYHHYGPYVKDVEWLARTDPAFVVSRAHTQFGSPKEVINANPDAPEPSLLPEEKDILNFVIEKTSPLYWNDFLALVYSTYPVRTQPKYSTLDLPELASQYLTELQAAES